MKGIAAIVMIPLWVFGIILAHGFWSTLFAIFVPLWSWCLAIEHLVRHFGLI
jgi:hypothetical protein